jgi:hypothetical protein
MERKKEGGASGSTKKLPWLLLFFACSTIWIFLTQNAALLKYDIYIESIDLEVQAPKAADGIDEESNTTSVDGSDTSYHRYSTIKHLFNDLAFSEKMQVKPMILKNFIRREGSGLKKNDIVLATQLSTSKLRNLLVQLQYWNGPVSVAVYISRLEDIDILFNFTEQNRPFIHQTSFHLVLEKTQNLLYPTNILRNVALEAIESDYFLALDVDHIPLPHNCHDKLVHVLSRIESDNKQNLLFVLPAFSLFPEKGEKYATADALPSSKEIALKLVKKRRMAQFWKKIFPQGHGPSNYTRWVMNTNTSDDFYEIALSQKQSILYEPYVVGFKPGIPRYWEGKTSI